MSRLSCSPTSYSLPGSSLPGISQARMLEWVTISFSRESSRPKDRTRISCISRQILYRWATREAQGFFSWHLLKNFHFIYLGHNQYRSFSTSLRNSFCHCYKNCVIFNGHNFFSRMLGIYMDTLNIFMRVASILATGGNRKKWSDSASDILNTSDIWLV